jgi:hypothetical protein
MNWQGDVLLFRSVHWPEADEREIRAELLDRWTARKRALKHPIVMPLDDLAEIADHIRPAQIACLAAFRSRDLPMCEFQWEAEVIREDDDILRLWAVLNPASRTWMLGDGLSTTRLSPAAATRSSAVLQRRVLWMRTPGDQERALRLRSDGQDPPALLLEITQAPRTQLRFPTSIPAPAKPDR